MQRRHQVFKRLQVLIADKFSVQMDDVREDSHFSEFKADSLDIVDLVMGIEEEFAIQIPDDHVERISSVQHAIDYIVDADPNI